MYQAFYRKYRPRCFRDVAGQEHITETLRQQIKNDRLSHAYLFVGTRGTGKTTCAKILSRAVNCLNPEDGEPCNKCLSCVGIEDGSILDVLELDAASNNSVDNVRELRDEAVYSPAAVKKRVYIVDEVHMLSISAFNALLKILEEPPEHILFILATTELHKVPETIQSRCQKYSFKRLSRDTLRSVLNSIAKQEGFTLTEEAAERLAALADGSMRDGISLLDQCATGDFIDYTRVQDTLGLAGQHQVVRLVEMVAARDIVSALCVLDELYNDGRDMTSLLNEVAALIRDILIFSLSPESGLIQNTGLEKSIFSILSAKLPPERLFFCLDILKSTISVLPRGGSSKLSLEMCLFNMCDERLSDDYEAIVSRIVKLEHSDLSHPKVEGNVKLESYDISHPVDTDEKVTEIIEDTEEDESIPETVPSDEAGVASDTEAVLDTGTTAAITGDFWPEILALLQREPSIYALLGNSSKVQARHQDNALVINVTDFFTANSIESDFGEIIKEAAAEVLGHNINVRVEIVDEIDDDEDSSGNIDNLSALGIL